MRKIFVCAALIVSTCAVPAGAADPMASLAYLVGTWHCKDTEGKASVDYTASFAYALGNGWMRERDAWSGSGSDEALITYRPKDRAWTIVVVESSERTTTVFRGTGSYGSHVTYASVYPNALLHETFDRVSQRTYAIHFHGTFGGKSITSVDVCNKE